MVYQDLSLCDTIDVAGNLFLGREPQRALLGVPLSTSGAMHADAAQMLDALGIRIPDHARSRSRTSPAASGSSIAIGRAASFDPLVLIMDEPTAALAVAEVEAVLDLIRTVSARGVSVILITHRLQDLFLVCDRIMVMYEGRNVAERRIGETEHRGGGQPDRRPKVPLRLPAGTRPESAARPSARPQPAAVRSRDRATSAASVRDNGAVAQHRAFFLVVMAVVFSLVTDTFLTEPTSSTSLRQSAPLLIVAVAMTFVITTGGIDLSVGSVAGAGQCACGDLCCRPACPGRWSSCSCCALGGVDRRRPGLFRRL